MATFSPPLIAPMRPIAQGQAGQEWPGDSADAAAGPGQSQPTDAHADQ